MNDPIQDTLNIALQHYDESSPNPNPNKHYMCFTISHLININVLDYTHDSISATIRREIHPFKTLNAFKKHHNITTSNTNIFKNWDKFIKNYGYDTRNSSNLDVL